MRPFSKGFAFVPLLIVFFLLVISAVTSYVVINQGTGGYSSRAGSISCGVVRQCLTFSSKAVCENASNSSYCSWELIAGGNSYCLARATYEDPSNTSQAVAACPVGAACKTTSQCVTGSSCSGGICKAPDTSCGSALNSASCSVRSTVCFWDASSSKCKDKIAEGQRCLLLTSAVPCQSGLTCVDDPNSTATANGLCKKSATPTPTKKPTVSDPKPTPTVPVKSNSCFVGSGYMCNQRTSMVCPDGIIDCQSGFTCLDSSNNPVAGTTRTGTCKARATDPKPTTAPTPGGGGGGGGGGDYGQGDGSCAATFSGATCQDTSSCTGTVHSGYCPGPATWKCCAPSSGGGGGGGTTTPTPSNKGVAPTCQLTGPKTVKIGEAVNYSATCADADNNLNKIVLYWAKKGESWNIFKTCEQSASGTGTCANSFTFTSPGTYYIVANGYDASGNKCTGYSWKPIPSDWAACGENDTIIVDMGSDVTLNFTLRLQGVTSQPRGGQTVPFKVKLKGPTDKDYVSGTLTANSAGKWTGSVAFSGVTVGEDKKYTIYIKVGKHLQKRVCAFAPTETSGGLYNCTDSAIPLAAGANNLDFSGIMLLAGDLPSSTGEQNGVVDSYDISYILNNLGATDATKMAIGDLNFDGVIDTQDRSLIIQSLNVKYDDQ